MNIAIEYFTVFGGLDIKLDTSKSIEELIEKHILKDYTYLRNVVSNITTGNPEYHMILTSLAMGDRRTNSAFKRSKFSFDKGIVLVDELCDLGILTLEKSLQEFVNLDEKYTVSEKLLFKIPFLRFWFAFISPIFKGIKEKNYEEFYIRYKNRKVEFPNLVFEQLSHQFLKKDFKNDPIVKIGRYWDDDIELDLIAKTESNKIIVGSCRYINTKINKSELTKLKKLTDSLKIDVDIFLIFSKKGFSAELKANTDEGLKLFSSRNFRVITEF